MYFCQNMCVTMLKIVLNYVILLISKEFRILLIYYSGVCDLSEKFESLLNHPMNSRERNTLPEKTKERKSVWDKKI